MALSDTPMLLQEMASDPVVQFTSWFNDAVKLNIKDYNAVNLATYDSLQKKVRSRIVLIKEITKDGIRFFTNYDSNKSKEILNHPQVAMTIYWSEIYRQVRFEGTVTKTSRQVSDDYFFSRPRESQVSAIISNQSSTINSRKELEDKYIQLFNSEAPITRPLYWGGFELKANYWEFWQGRNHRLHDRIAYSMDPNLNSWSKKLLAP